MLPIGVIVDLGLVNQLRADEDASVTDLGF